MALIPPKPASIRTVQCYHCRRSFDVPGRAMSISCPWCSTRVTLDDLVVSEKCWTTKMRTCGRILVQRAGNVTASLIEAREGIEILGSVTGSVVCGGPVLIGPKARVNGDVAAPSIWVEPGATIVGGHFRIASEKGLPVTPPVARIPEPSPDPHADPASPLRKPTVNIVAKGARARAG